jgi:glycosyltransferase involved in cell wall biosynthesis
MLNGKKIVVVMPAYNASLTLEQTYAEIPHNIVDQVILVDDKSADDTVCVANTLGIDTTVHTHNLGYGGNQKTCYRKALEKGADIVIMLHPDYQYTPKLIMAMASLISEGLFDCVLGSRILGTGALRGGMPLYKYVANRMLTFYQNLLLRHKLSEYHTGYRAFSKEILEFLPLDYNDNAFVFDNQMLTQIIYAGYSIGEITCPTRYFKEASSIRFWPSVRYGTGVVRTTVECVFHEWGILKSPRFAPLDQIRKQNKSVRY